MTLKHLLLVLITVAIWGSNFVFIRIGLGEIPPLLFCALRFIFTALPAVFFLKRPPIAWKTLIAYGLVLFALQFSFLFCGMKAGMSPGLASLLMQFQVFFTMGLAAWLLNERPKLSKVIAALVAVSGIAVVAFHIQGEVTLLGLLFTLMAAFCWSCGNIIAKKIGSVNPLSLVVWGCLVASPVLIAAAWAIEGQAAIQLAFEQVSWKGMIAVAYNAYLSTHVSYSLWNYLIAYHPTATIAPFTLLVPVFGFACSVIFLGEELPLWKIWAGVLVIAGLCFNILSDRRARSHRR